MSDLANMPVPPALQDPESLGAVLLRVLIDLALRQPDPVEREAMLEILRKDGWLK